jgi:hypothetical protein
MPFCRLIWPPGDRRPVIVGFTLFINGGFITSFEGYTWDVAWPEELMEDRLILDQPRGEQCLTQSDIGSA